LLYSIRPHLISKYGFLTKIGTDFGSKSAAVSTKQLCSAVHANSIIPTKPGPHLALALPLASSDWLIFCVYLVAKKLLDSPFFLNQHSFLLFFFFGSLSSTEMQFYALLLPPVLATLSAARPASVSSSPVADNSTASACSPAVIALASGIQSNIADQNNELATVTALGNVLSQNPMDMTLYAATQASLLGFVTKGIQIREENQRIAPAGNGAIAGLVS
jgi:hypothetical protein